MLLFEDPGHSEKSPGKLRGKHRRSSSPRTPHTTTPPPPPPSFNSFKFILLELSFRPHYVGFPNPFIFPLGVRSVSSRKMRDTLLTLGTPTVWYMILPYAIHSAFWEKTWNVDQEVDTSKHRSPNMFLRLRTCTHVRF
jgi:hypothetical protein